MLTLLRKALWTSALLLLLASNVLTLTSAAFNTALSTALATGLGIRTVTSTLTARLQASEQAALRNRAIAQQRKTAARRFGRTLVARSQRVAARSVAAIPVESLPYVGAAAIVVGTAYELYAMCETLRDLDTLYASLGIDEESSEDTVQELCSTATELSSAG